MDELTPDRVKDAQEERRRHRQAQKEQQRQQRDYIEVENKKGLGM